MDGFVEWLTMFFFALSFNVIGKHASECRIFVLECIDLDSKNYRLRFSNIYLSLPTLNYFFVKQIESYCWNITATSSVVAIDTATNVLLTKVAPGA